MEQTQALFSEWEGRVTMMPVYFRNVLGESLVNLSWPAAAAKTIMYMLCDQPGSTTSRSTLPAAVGFTSMVLGFSSPSAAPGDGSASPRIQAART